MKVSLGIILLSAVLFQLGFISFFLFSTRKGKRLSNVLLGLFFTLIALNFLEMLLSTLGLQSYYGGAAFLDDGLILGFGPLAFLYTRSIIYKNYRLSQSDALHFVPMVVVTAILTISLSLLSVADQESMLTDIQNYNLGLSLNVFVISLYAHIGLYAIATYVEVRKYKRYNAAHFASFEHTNQEWLDFLMRSFGVLMMVMFAHVLIPRFLEGSYAVITFSVFILYLFYFINRIMLKVLNDSDLLSGISRQKEEKYAASTLTENEREEYKIQLLQYMEIDKPYLDPAVTIDGLSEKLDIHPKVLSQVINQSFQKNFFDFINGYRIEKAKELLIHPENQAMTVLEVLYECGFSSKSSFNTFFKKITGQTPSQFRKTQLS